MGDWDLDRFAAEFVRDVEALLAKHAAFTDWLTKNGRP